MACQKPVFNAIYILPEPRFSLFVFSPRNIRDHPSSFKLKHYEITPSPQDGLVEIRLDNKINPRGLDLPPSSASHKKKKKKGMCVFESNFLTSSSYHCLIILWWQCSADLRHFRNVHVNTCCSHWNSTRW